MNLKSLLKRVRGTLDIHALKFSNLGWEDKTITKGEIIWTCPHYPATLSVIYCDTKPALPTPISDVNQLRSYYRQLLLTDNGGLIKVDQMCIQDTCCVEALIKMPKQPSGILYVNSLTLPFSNCCYVIRMQIGEGDMSGIREAVVAQKLLSENKVTYDGHTISGWQADPYLSSYTGGTLMNISEMEEYDDMFPEHPLTLIRRHMKTVIGSIEFSGKLKRLAGLN